jgi:predicted secreted protein
MAETNALIGYGVHLARGDGASPEVYTNLAELIDLTTPSMTKDQVEATHTDSPDGFREFIPGLKDGGEFSATCNYAPGNATQGNASGGALNDFINETSSRNWRITFPGSPATTWTFKATIIGYEIATPMDDRITITISFKVAGAPTIA